VTAHSEQRSTDIGNSNGSVSRSKSLFVDLRIRCLRQMWRGACASVGWSRQGRWYVFRGLCKTIGKHSAYLRGLWNVGVYPEKGMMLRLHWKDLVSAVMTTRAESRISHGLFVVRNWLTDPSADVAPILLFSYITCIWT
jgi:hypothetical protein